MRAGLPAAVKTHGGGEKPLLVSATRDLLPDAVVERRKMGFTLPFEQWMRGPLREEVAGCLLEATYGGAVADTLVPAAVAGVWRDFERGRTSCSRAWALYVVKTWGELHSK